jgi:hypothetical protein
MSWGKAYKLFVKSVNGEWILRGLHYQDPSWMDEDIQFFRSLGLETRTEEYRTMYADEG